MWINSCRVLGWSAFAGVAVVLVAYVLNYPLAKYSVHVRLKVPQDLK